MLPLRILECSYLVLRGLTKTGWDDMAADIAANYHHQVVECFKRTGTVWVSFWTTKT